MVPRILSEQPTSGPLMRQDGVFPFALKLRPKENSVLHSRLRFSLQLSGGSVPLRDIPLLSLSK